MKQNILPIKLFRKHKRILITDTRKSKNPLPPNPIRSQKIIQRNTRQTNLVHLITHVIPKRSIRQKNLITKQRQPRILNTINLRLSNRLKNWIRRPTIKMVPIQRRSIPQTRNIIITHSTINQMNPPPS